MNKLSHELKRVAQTYWALCRLAFYLTFRLYAESVRAFMKVMETACPENHPNDNFFKTLNVYHKIIANWIQKEIEGGKTPEEMKAYVCEQLGDSSITMVIKKGSVEDLKEAIRGASDSTMGEAIEDFINKQEAKKVVH